AIFMAGDPDSKVLGMVSYAWGGFGAAFGPVIIASLFWHRVTREGALAGIVVGAVTVLVWKQNGWLGLYEIVPGFILGSIAIVVASLLGSPPSPAMQEKWRQAGEEARRLGL
ncbi:MAG: sodium:proline symporter, partial [Ottowia sp.]|nr:sodium:proline symporter [Ottowia sp.]